MTALKAQVGEYLDLHIAGADIRLIAPADVISVLQEMFVQIERRWVAAEPLIEIVVSFDSDSWEIRGGASSSRKTLYRTSTAPQLAGAAIGSLLSELANHKRICIWRAAVIERRGSAIALVGNDWESSITLAAHMHARGWRIVSGDYALVDLSTMRALPFRKALHMNSTCVMAFPSAYRAAIEASPWYSSEYAISFYAVEPPQIDERSPWGDFSKICLVLNVDGRIAETPSLEDPGDFAITQNLKSSSLPTDVYTALLILGGFNATVDLIESRFSSLIAQL